MDKSLEQFQATLRSHKQSATRQRLRVFQELQKHETLTMQQLIQACSRLDRASVYRTITLFERLGIVQRLQIGWKYRIELSNEFQHHHHHLYCVRCHGVIVIPEDTLLEGRIHVIADKQGFRASDHQIEIRGRCKNCQDVTTGT